MRHPTTHPRRQTGQLRKIPGSEQFNKLFDRMIALLAILSHVCPKSAVDDAIASIVREKHSNNLSKIEAGEEGYEDLFVFACPKFVNPAVPDYGRALRPGCPPVPYGQDAYKLQVQHFMTEMSAHATLRRMRSYMSLYTSIEVEKLASFNDIKVEEFGPWLVCFKHKMRQLERGEAAEAASSSPKGVVRGVSSDMDRVGTALDIHYQVSGNVVHVDEAEKTRRFETFFMKQIENNDDILRQLENIQIEM
jgi:translation initiation factor 3 subunit L